jgi:hypothetical protein
MNTILLRPFALILLAAPFLFTACKKDKDPAPADENEVITTVTYTLTPVGGGTPVAVTFRDPDGDQGSQQPTIGTLTLAANTAYTGALTVLDETKSPVENTTAEILEKSDEHLFVYTVNPAGLLTIARTDRDKNNIEVGLATSVQTQTTAGTGVLNIVLRHQPGTKNGTATPGSSDVDVTFPVVVQ